MRRGLKNIAAGTIRVLYRACELLPQRDVIAFLSRQSHRPLDFRLIEPELRRRFPDSRIEWACVEHGGQLGIGLFLRQLNHVATARLCLVDGYVPAVSIPKRHRSACVQMWHAMGAVKKFGYQCLDTPDGRSSVDAEVFRMHRGYDLIVAGMPGAVPAFAGAFDADAGKIEPLGLPRMDYLLSDDFAEERAADAQRVRARLGLADGDGRLVVLYAPTLRRGNADADWLVHNVQALSRAFAGRNELIVVAGHPLEKASLADIAGECGEGEGAAAGAGEGAAATAGPVTGAPVVNLSGATIRALGVADVVVSDYSATVFEAALAGKPVKFFVPDIDEYRRSPGLNIDPVELFPADTHTSADSLAQDVCRMFADGVRPQLGDMLADPDTFAAYFQDYAAHMESGSIARIVDRISSII